MPPHDADTLRWYAASTMLHHAQLRPIQVSSLFGFRRAAASYGAKEADDTGQPLSTYTPVYRRATPDAFAR